MKISGFIQGLGINFSEGGNYREKGSKWVLLMGKGKLTPDLRIRREKGFSMVFPPFG